jgi:large subunit ribosomal protein L25
METKFELIAEFREGQGKGASRRLRRAGRVPAILYGGKREPKALTIDQTKLQLALANERFFSSIITLKVGDQSQAAILRDIQRHPWRNQIVHLDMQRVLEDEALRVAIPLHFKGDDVAPGVKSEGGMMSHMRNELEITCLPKDLPEFIEVDVSALHLNESLHVSDLKLPAGVTAVELAKGLDPAVAAVHVLRAEEVEPTPVAAAAVAGAPVAGAAAAPAGTAAATAGAPAAPAAPGDKKAEPAKAEPAKPEGKKDTGKK